MPRSYSRGLPSPLLTNRLGTLRLDVDVVVHLGNPNGPTKFLGSRDHNVAASIEAQPMALPRFKISFSLSLRDRVDRQLPRRPVAIWRRRRRAGMLRRR